MKTSNFSAKEVQLLIEAELENLMLASKNLNPLLTYVKFILTDDKPNSNNNRIPKEEFANIIKSGLFMPLKMAFGGISENHEDSFPIGVITHLREDDDKIRGIGALWNKERPEDVDFIKKRYAEGKPLDLSWEIGYKDSSLDENGIEILRGCILRATTLIGIPAYQGRTNITDVDMANKDSNKEERNVEKELEKLRAELDEYKGRVAELEKTQKTEEDIQRLEEFNSLKEFKDNVEAEAARLEKLTSIRNSFSKAGVSRDDKFFEENEDLLLTLDEVEGALAFFIAQLTLEPEEEKEKEEEEEKKEEEKKEDDSVNEEEEEEEEENEDEKESESSNKKVPNLKRIQEKNSIFSGVELGKALRSRKLKKDK
jgi:hypothetical protein